MSLENDMPTTPETPAGEPTQQGLTQADVDRHAAAARKQGMSEGVTEFAKSLGFSNADEIKTLLTDVKTRQEAEKTELQKAADRAADLEKQLAAVRQQHEETVQAARLEKLRNNTLQEVNSAGVKPDRAKHALSLIEANGKLAGVMADDGTVDEKKLKIVVADFKKELPELFGNPTPGTPSNSDASPSAINSEDAKKAIETMKRVARW
jgi:prolyl-tRNA editing enzyme YbaK/EbsC (Cys-tRNA(Pro) deacylase)